MPHYTLYQVDAFASKVFEGNPAAVIISDEYPDVQTMQHIAMENNLAETAFVKPLSEGYEIRWFTPAVEVDLCGHATLAAGYVIFNFFEKEVDVVNFYSPRSGKLQVNKLGDGYLQLDFPADQPKIEEIPEIITDLFMPNLVEVYRGKDDWMVVLQDEADVKGFMPDFEAIACVKARGLIITAKGTGVDFVSRFFAPQSGINEDPVTGSAHTLLTPYWSEKLGKQTLTAKQLSTRGGQLTCTLKSPRVLISGKAVLYMKGEVRL